MNVAMIPESVLTWDFFASFGRRENSDPIIRATAPDWAAAAHVIVVNRTVHYFWSKRERPPRWILMHATAPVSDPSAISQDERNAIVLPSEGGFDDEAIEYPFPFHNSLDQQYYMYYRGKGKGLPEQTGLLVNAGTMSEWRRVSEEPVISAEYTHEADGATHPSAAIEDDTIHILYTGKATKSYEDGLTMCHATAPASNPAAVVKDPRNPVFTGSGAAWDSRAIRETEILRGSEYFHILYGGYDGERWRLGHVRTQDFFSFEPNPYSPVFSPSTEEGTWDCDSVLTGQIFRCGSRCGSRCKGRCESESESAYYMVYAGFGQGIWQTGLAKSRTTAD